ncbi:hypothetical protein XBFM1_1090009 [Xenorhabdus bovienii str. feltiae Moldova]|uniref:Uncharacterized protein n=1 Tax=Xenorhabdus bovienii str. feltiae Moldova TaxID=1398200 RepID=A0A077NLA8_XENBV|nr:hypothetical protein XBFM1_1090009 [Xenorhabdus bovienii str. feltiae Moldova]
MEPLGIEPSPDALQASARTLYAKVPDMKKATPERSLEFVIRDLNGVISFSLKIGLTR